MEVKELAAKISGTDVIKEQLYAVTMYFNPMKWNTRERLFNEFVPRMKCAGCILFVVEVAIDAQDFVVTQADNPFHLQLRTKAVLWHKERALNLGIQRLMQLVPDAKYIATIDADVAFSNPNWVDDTIFALHHHDVVQMFSYAQNLNSKNTIMWVSESFFFKFVNKGYNMTSKPSVAYMDKGHPGLAWAWTADALEKLGGLFDVAIAGSGDLHMAYALTGEPGHDERFGLTPGLKRYIKLWQDRCDKYIKKNVGYVDGCCLHYWHGASDKRGYDTRWRITETYQYDPYEDIYTALNGLYKYAGNKPMMEQDIKRSLSERNEDAPTVPKV